MEVGTDIQVVQADNLNRQPSSKNAFAQPEFFSQGRRGNAL